VSLLGRLEDLSLTDIIQIVYLSRRTGVLEIINDRGRHTVMFRQGLVVNASSPEHPDLLAFLQVTDLVSPQQAALVRQMEESGIPSGTALLEMNVLSKDDLANAVHQRILTVVAPLLSSKEGEFNFILSDSMSPADLEHEPEQLFKEGGIPPNRIFGTAEGEKLKPLKGLEDSLKAGKTLLRGAAMPETTPASLNLGLGQPIEPQPATGRPSSGEPDLAGGSVPTATDNVLPFPSRDEFTPLDELGGVAAFTPPPEAQDERQLVQSASRAGQFKVAGGLFEVESPDAAYRNVVLFERNPLVRVAARRAFTKQGVKIFQYGSLDDVRTSMTELFASNSFFVTFLELTPDDASGRLMQQIKRRNPRLPVVLIDGEADLRRRHDLLRRGADLYLTKPSPARLQPGLIEEELALFADELVLFAERSFSQWEQATGGGAEAGKKFYEQASKETIDRSFGVLRQLINELSNPNDIGEVSATILRLSAEYLDRGALFVAAKDAFVGVGGFGATGGGEAMDARVRGLSIGRDQPSLLADVASAKEPHHGKMRRTAANVELIERLGGILPTEVVALPILHATRAIGILYGDNAVHRTPIDSMTGLEIFLSQAGYAFGNAVFASEKNKPR
jgi:DNA-binding NarL/FixJ family response regulator